MGSHRLTAKQIDKWQADLGKALAIVAAIQVETRALVVLSKGGRYSDLTDVSRALTAASTSVAGANGMVGNLKMGEERRGGVR